MQKSVEQEDDMLIYNWKPRFTGLNQKAGGLEEDFEQVKQWQCCSSVHVHLIVLDVLDGLADLIFLCRMCTCNHFARMADTACGVVCCAAAQAYFFDIHEERQRLIRQSRMRQQ